MSNKIIRAFLANMLCPNCGDRALVRVARITGWVHSPDASYYWAPGNMNPPSVDGQWNTEDEDIQEDTAFIECLGCHEMYSDREIKDIYEYTTAVEAGLIDMPATEYAFCRHCRKPTKKKILSDVELCPTCTALWVKGKI